MCDDKNSKMRTTGMMKMCVVTFLEMSETHLHHVDMIFICYNNFRIQVRISDA